MSVVTATRELPGLIADLETVAAAARRTFGGLNAVELNWQPYAGEWSVAQCFEHLILINEAYVPVFVGIARGDWTPTWKERLPLLPKLFGKIVLNAVQPDTKRKFKALPKFQPSSSAIASDIIDRFIAHQHELGRHIETTAGRDWDRTIITSPAVSFFTYSLFDAYRIIVTHEKHHVAQAERVIGSPGFPRATATPTR